ncbi:MAG TPA: hypothetical protein VFX84_03840 [Candidatus Saccharimonadales bacterium]|nr:hypothetical protein [Candidatus Saccharimonadales bacterium]
MNDLLELANLYPSPHNGQPVRLKRSGPDTFEAYFEKGRGLKAADISYIFSFVSMGVFIEHMSLCAAALGHGFSYKLHLPEESDLHGTGLVRFATCYVRWHSQEPDDGLFHALGFRQTSRKKYKEGVSRELAEEVARIAADEHMELQHLSDKQAQQAIWLNQRAVFDDMSDEAVRRELDHWLRYTRQEKEKKKDGLAYDCMELNGRLMKRIVDHPAILKAPVISWLLKQYYLRTMSDSSDVFYVMAPFANGEQAFNVGTVIMRIWKTVAEAGRYLHPFGTIMSNRAAHKDFLELAGVRHESRSDSYLVFIYRCGKSERPVRSLRMPYREHLLMEGAHV